MLPATTRSSLLSLRCSKVGLMTYWPSTRPTRRRRSFSGRDLGERERRRRAGDGQDVGVVLSVGREHERDDLRLVAPARGKERPDRPVDDPARQHFLFGRLAFALEEAARNAARCVGVFAVVDRQRQEIDAFARVRRAAGRDEDDRIAVADDDRSVGLLGELAGFESKGLAADVNSRVVINEASEVATEVARGSYRSRARRTRYLRMFRRLIRSA